MNNYSIHHRNSFKCAAFLLDLPDADDRLSWIGGMPDLLFKKSVASNKEFLQSFGLPVSKKSFVFPSEECSEVTANSRCYAFVSPIIIFIQIDPPGHGLIIGGH